MIITKTITTTGSAGSASGSVTTDIIRGLIDNIQFDYSASAPATTDITVTEADGMQRTLLTVSNNNTDGDYPVSIQQVDSTGSNTGSYRIPYVESALTISVAQSDALAEAVKVRIQVIGLGRS